MKLKKGGFKNLSGRNGYTKDIKNNRKHQKKKKTHNEIKHDSLKIYLKNTVLIKKKERKHNSPMSAIEKKENTTDSTNIKKIRNYY